MFKNSTKIIIITLLFLPIFSFAALDLEYGYPQLPTGQTISTASSLGDVITYFVAWAIIIGALIAFISLIIAGSQYLASTGRPEAMGQAKNRIFNSFLGLTILLGSYLILMTVNPQLIVMEIEKVPIEYGIVLFSEDGKNTLISPPTELSGLAGARLVEEIVKRGQAVYLPYKIPDAEEAFKKNLVSVEKDSISGKVTKVNFKDFGITTSIGFLSNTWWETGSEPVKVIAYAEKDFKKFKQGEPGAAKEYTSAGELNSETGSTAVFSLEFNGVKVIDLAFFETKVKYIKDSEGEETKEVLHPPLSFERKTLRPGVFLYSNKPGYEVRLDSSEEDFRTIDSIDFNDETQRIEIINDEAHKYIAVLHENPYYSDQLRIFFQGFEYPEKSGKLVGNLNLTPDDDIRKTIGKPIIDQYGRVEEPSSIQIKQLSDDPSTCKRVEICTGTEFFGECFVYLPPDKTIKLNENVWLATSSLPIYLPQNIPKSTTTKKLTEGNGEVEATTTEFSRNINSIKIEGSCLVVLFEKKIHSERDERDVGCSTNHPEKCWDGGGGPGTHSEVFIESDIDLSDNPINECRPLKGFAFWTTKPCASAIAIYPIK